MENKIVTYAEGWMKERASQKKISLMPLEFHGNVFGIEIRFSATKYNTREGFEELVDNVNRRSGGMLSLLSDESNYRHGVISYAVAHENHGYSDTKITKTVDYIINFISSKDNYNA